VLRVVLLAYAWCHCERTTLSTYVGSCHTLHSTPIRWGVASIDSQTYGLAIIAELH